MNMNEFERHQYEARVNKLIAKAVRFADGMTDDPWLWDKHYHDEMHRLTAEHGLRSIGGYMQRAGGYRETRRSV